MAGWAVGLPADLSTRDRGLIVLASVSPDVDALPVAIDLIRGSSADGMEFWSRFHHSAHNLPFAIGMSIACLALAKRRVLTGTLAFLAIHLHYICDIIGSRGPDGYQWPIPFLSPFSDSWQLTVPWQWELNAWPNMVVAVALLALILYVAWRRGYSPVGIFSSRADQAFVAVLRGWFGPPKG